MAPLTDQQANYLGILYQGCLGEINRLRDLEWRLTAQIVAIYVGVVLLYFKDEADNGHVFKCVLSIVMTGGLVFYLSHMAATHHYISVQRKMRARIEGVMGIHDPTAFGGVTLGDASWLKPQSYWFEFNSVIVPLILSAILSYGLSLWVLWWR